MRTQKMLALALTQLRQGKLDEASTLFASVASSNDLGGVISALSGSDIEVGDVKYMAKDKVSASLSRGVNRAMLSDELSDHKFGVSESEYCEDEEEEDVEISLSPLTDLDLDEDEDADEEEEESDSSTSVSSPIRF